MSACLPTTAHTAILPIRSSIVVTPNNNKESIGTSHDTQPAVTPRCPQPRAVLLVAGPPASLPESQARFGLGWSFGFGLRTSGQDNELRWRGYRRKCLAGVPLSCQLRSPSQYSALSNKGRPISGYFLALGTISWPPSCLRVEVLTTKNS